MLNRHCTSLLFIHDKSFQAVSLQKFIYYAPNGKYQIKGSQVAVNKQPIFEVLIYVFNTTTVRAMHDVFLSMKNPRLNWSLANAQQDSFSINVPETVMVSKCSSTRASVSSLNISGTTFLLSSKSLRL